MMMPHPERNFRGTCFHGNLGWSGAGDFAPGLIFENVYKWIKNHFFIICQFSSALFMFLLNFLMVIDTV